MSISYTEQNDNNKTDRVKEALCDEINKMMTDIKEGGIDWSLLFSHLNKRTSKLEWMIIESAYKGAPLEKLDNTLLILPHKYIEMLKYVTVELQNLFHNTTNIIKTRTILK